MTTLLLPLLLAAHPRPTVPEAPININQASLTELMDLPGIGRTRAMSIVLYRRHRPFKRSTDLLRIKGIGPHVFRRLKPLVTVAAAPDPGPQ